MKYQRALSIGLLTLLITASTVLAPRPAYALFGIGDVVIDPTNLIQNTITATNAGKNLLNPIFYRIAQSAIQSMVRSTVNWINNGFNGSPAYATDLKGTLQDAADQEARRFITELKSNQSINSPFRDGVANDVLQAYYLATSRDGFAIRNPYTLNQVSSDADAFQRGDISKGGLPAWLTETLIPSNNWLGARQLIESSLSGGVTDTAGTINGELIQGGGFLSWRKCDVEGTVGKDTSTTEYVDILDDNGKPTGKKEAIVSAISLTPTQTCLNSHIETPGSVIANKINQSLGLGAESLVQAKEFDQIVNALLSQLLNNVLGNTGLAGLSRGSTATGGRAYFDQTTTSTTGGTSVIGSFTQVLDSQTTQLQTYLTNWQTINTAAQQAKSALQQSSCISNAQDIINASVQPVITKAATAIGSVPSALTAIDAIRSHVLAVAASDAGQQTTVLQQASADYQNLLSGNTLPTTSDISEAAQQAQDSGSSTPVSLLTQMNQFTTQARCGS